MDVYTTASAAIRDIYAIVTFIRTVAIDIKEKRETLEKIQFKLEHEFVFVEAFLYLFHSDNGDSQWFQRLPLIFQTDFQRTTEGLKKALSSYENVALKHGLDLSKERASFERDEQSTGLHLSDDQQKESLPQKPVHESKIERFRLRIKSATESRIGKVQKNIEWSLFDKGELAELVTECQIWMEKLRQTMMLILCAGDVFGSYNAKRLVKGDGKNITVELGVDEAVGRQFRERVRPSDDEPLEGNFRADATSYLGRASSYAIGTFDGGPYTGERNAIKETCGFMASVKSSWTAKDQKQRLELVRRLAWLLADDSVQPAKAADPAEERVPMYLLKCLGYCTSGKFELSLVYEMPEKDNKPLTLHDCIVVDREAIEKLAGREKSFNTAKKTRESGKAETTNKELYKEKYRLMMAKEKVQTLRRKKQLQLSDRVYIAWILASTLYNVHTSRWVHKGISSHAVLIFPSSNGRKTPYLVGWSLSRPQTDEFRICSARARILENESLDSETSNSTTTHSRDVGHELELDLYQHPERYPGNSTTYENMHDIYSLGICLLEIGLWSTISIEMSQAIRHARETSEFPRSQWMKLMHNQIISRSRDGDLENNMGIRYATIVRTCLDGSFESLSGLSGETGRPRDEARDAQLAREFQELVVKPLQLQALAL